MTMNAQYLNRYLLFVKSWYIKNIYGKMWKKQIEY